MQKGRGRACATSKGEEKYIENFGGKPEGNNHVQDLGIDEDNKQIVLKEVGWGGVN
jgi:hypothetical protein